MTPIKVLHVITRFIDGGADLNTFHSIQALLEEGHYEIGLAVGRDSDSRLLEHLPGVIVHRIPSLRRAPSLLHDVIALKQLYKIIRRNRYQIIHTHTAKAGILGRFAARAASASCVIHGLHGMTFHRGLSWYERALYRRLERLAASMTHCIVSVGDDLKSRYLSAGVGSPEQYRVIHSGMRLDEFFRVAANRTAGKSPMRRALGFRETDVVIGKVGRYEERKGYRHLIEAARRICATHPHVRFVLVGEGPQQAELEALIAEHRLQNVVRLMGFREDIAQVLGALDIFAFSSLWEGLPQVLVQAAASGLPIVTFRVEGASEVVQSGVNGYLVELGDVAGLTQRLTELVGDLARAHQMGACGQEMIRGRWSVETQMNETRLLYRELVERHLLPAEPATWVETPHGRLQEAQSQL